MALNLIRRLVKGEPLTAEDHDSNLDVLEEAIEDSGGGGGTPPGGADGQVQFNKAGAFAGDVGLTFDPTAGSLTVGTTLAFGDDNTRLYLESEGVIGQIGGATQGQGFFVYRTFTGSNNYERVGLDLQTNTFRFGPQQSGTGTLRPLYVSTGSTTAGALASAAAVGAGARCFVTDATSAVAGTIVAGGGSTALSVESDGTNWRVTSGRGAITDSSTDTLTNKTLGSLKESVYTITDSPAFEISPANGPIQTVTLGADRSPLFISFENGQSVKLKIDDGTGFTITWPEMEWIGQTPGESGTAPELGATGFTHVELWCEGATYYGCLIGYTAS